MARAALQVGLFLGFIWHFGAPAVKRYYSMKVMVVTDKRQTGGIVGPTITVIARNTITREAWREEPLAKRDHSGIVEGQCSEYEHLGSIEECIKKKTYEKSDTIEGLILGFNSILTENGPKETLTDCASWTEDFTTSWGGRSFSVTVPRAIGTDFLTDELFLQFDRSLLYDVFVHDKEYFILNQNEFGLPTTHKTLAAASLPDHYYELVLVEHEELNVATDPCTEDPAYSFRTCIKESLSSKVGEAKS
jgi:hypothetical protein